MFYTSPWFLYGLMLGTIYLVLKLLGYEGKRHENKTRKKSESELLTSAQTVKAISVEKEAERSYGEADEAGGRKELRKSYTPKEFGSQTAFYSYEEIDSKKSLDGLKLAPAGSKKVGNSIAEQTVEACAEDVLESQDTLYLQEFNVTGDFISERQSIRLSSHGRENAAEILSQKVEIEGSGSLEATYIESKENVTEASSSSVGSEPLEETCKCSDSIVTSNEQSAVSSSVEECHPTIDLEQSRLFDDFANHLVATAKTKALQNIDLECKANYLAERISSEIIRDVIGQFSTGSVPRDQEMKSPNIQGLHSFAGNVVDSLIHEASGNVSLVNNIALFANDLSEQVINDGMENYAAMEKLRQGRRQKLSLNEVRIFSEGVVSEAVSDGIDEAVGLDVNIQESVSADKNSAESTVVTQQAGLSNSLQPHITGVVENIVNNAIYEAALRVKGKRQEPELEDPTVESSAREILESQVSGTVQELIVSALQEVAEYKGKIGDNSVENASELDSRMGSFVENTLDAAVSEAAGRVIDQHSMSVADQDKKLLNGHVDISLESTLQITDQSQGIDEVPFKRGAGEGDNYWRQSLILDLEGNEGEFDESIESGRSHTSTAESPLTPKEKEIVSDEDESEEFVDSSEDEVIDHAADAKFGAMGGSNVEKDESDEDDDAKMGYGDEFDDNISGDDDEDEDDSDDDVIDDNEMQLAGQTMVDGLCASKPKERRRKKSKKSKLLRPRIQPAGSQYNTAVILDNGSGVIKLGLGGSKMPTVVQPALYGIPKRYSLQMAAMENKKDRHYGSSATSRAGVLQLEYPMSSGFLENWSDVEDIWEYLLYDELGLEEGNHPVLVTEVANTPKKHREKMAEILFEHLGVPAMYVANQLVLSLYASGLTVGMCLSSGFSVTQAAAIYEGHLIAHTVQELDIGGKALTDNLQKLLRENKGHNLNSSSGWQIVNTMKEKMAYVAKDYNAELNGFKTSDALTQFYSLPDGQTVQMSSEMISTVEPLFNPDTLVGVDDTVASQMPLHMLVNAAFKRCSSELQYDICRNVVLSGGTTLTKGLVPRLENELSKINPKIRSVRAPAKRAYSAWIGGSILGSLSTLDSMYATIDEYADYGGKIVNQKCF